MASRPLLICLMGLGPALAGAMIGAVAAAAAQSAPASAEVGSCAAYSGRTVTASTT